MQTFLASSWCHEGASPTSSQPSAKQEADLIALIIEDVQQQIGIKKIVLSSKSRRMVKAR